jgi:phosphonate transport system substrate-binding protein
MKLTSLVCLVGLMSGLCAFALPATAAEPLKFGVLNQHPVALTAKLWNPILQYLGKKSGVPLTLGMGKTAQETTARTLQGEFDFVYTNHLFTPERDKLRFRVLARFNTDAIRGQIVVADNSPIRSLRDLRGKKIAFPSSEAFAGYALPVGALEEAGVKTDAVFTGNQESAMTQLASGVVDAAGVNDTVMKAFAQRENFHYRTLYTSPPYHGLAVMAHPRVARSTVEKVRKALLAMGRDAEGRKLLAAANVIIRSEYRLEFVSASTADYNSYRRFYRNVRQ